MDDKKLEELADQLSLEFAYKTAEKDNDKIPHDVIPEIWKEAQKDAPKIVANMYKPLVKWILQNYEIVSRDKIRKERETAEWTGNEGGLYVLKMLFPA